MVIVQSVVSRSGYLLLILSVLIPAALASAKPMTADEWYRYQAAVGEELRDLARQVRDGDIPPIKCATPLFLDVFESRPAEVAYTPAFTDREDSMSYTHASNHFFLHYTDNGANAVYQYDIQTIIPGTPDYIVHAGRILDSVWEHTVGDLGFPSPISDGYYNGGGNGLMDIYFVNIAAYGVTILDSIQPTLPATATVYIFLENDYQGFPGYEGNRLNALRVTAAHEFTHAVQFALDVTELEGSAEDFNPAWIEMSATFMEEEHYPEIDDYLNYLIFFYDVPQWSLRTGTFLASPTINYWRNLHMYGSVIFPIYLSEQYGPEIIREIWSLCGAIAGPNWVSATDQALVNASGGDVDFASAFQEFALWNVFTGYRTRSDFFPDAGYYDTVNLTARVLSYPADISPSPDSVLPDNLGANYIFLENVSNYFTGLSVELIPQSSDLRGLTVVGLPYNINDPVAISHIQYDTMSGPVQIADAYEYERIALVLSVLGGDDLKIPYELRVNFLCADIDGVPEINLNDAMFLLNYIFKGGPSADPVCAGDANGDADINVGDALYIINYIFKGGPGPSGDCCR